jgi:hypothetical protein
MEESSTDSPGGSRRPSSLFWLVGLATIGGIVAAAAADSETPGFALNSVWVYRAEVGLAFLGAIYLVAMTLWLAWYGKGFFELGAFGSTLKAPGAEEIEEAGDDVSDVGKEIEKLQEETTGGLKELDERVTALENQAPS